MSRKPKAAPEVLAPEASEQLTRDVALVTARSTAHGQRTGP